MDPIEDRLRTSLHERAEDVEVTPHLWQEVDRRVTRRGRWTIGSWAAVTAAVAVAAVVVVPSLLPDASVPQVADRPDGVEDPTAPGDGMQPDDLDDPGDPGDPPPAPGFAEVDTGPLLVSSDRVLRVLDAAGTTLHAYELPQEGESTVTGLAVQPGSTVDELLGAVITTAEGMHDLRVLRGDRDGITLEPVDDPTYRPGAGAAASPVVSGPVWAPDGTSLAWLEQDEDGVRLRTIGWDDGPGTGDPATDNAVFTVAEGGEEPLELVDWLPIGSDRFLLRATTLTPSDSWFELELLRQADGAWALEPGAALERVEAAVTGDGPVRAIAGAAEGPDGSIDQPAWLVRDSAEGPVAILAPMGEARSFPLPAEVLGTEPGLAAWAVAVDGGVIVGSPGSGRAAVCSDDGTITLLDGEVAFLSPIR